MKDISTSTSYVRKTYDELTFTDDFMFCKVMGDKEICKRVIREILRIDVEDIEYITRQKDFSPEYDSKGIRMDVYVKGSDKVFDIEMQVRKEKDIAFRLSWTWTCWRSPSTTLS